MRFPFAAVLILLVAGSPVAMAAPLPDAASAGQIQQRLRETTRAVRMDGSRGLQQRRLAGEKAPAALNAIVLMCDFSDSLMLGRFGQVPGDFPEPRQTDRYYAAHDSVFFDHQLSKVADYYTAVSGGKLLINYDVHPRTVNLPEPMGFYGNHPTEGEQAILLAAQVVDSLAAEVDFATYDTVILVHAGAGEETDILGDSPEQIFSTYLDPDDFADAVDDSLLAQPYLPAPGFAPGTGIDRVLVLPETEQQDAFGGFGGGFGSLGVYCFEIGLHLGMLSLSDFTPPGRPDSQGIGQYGLMGYGLFVGLGYIPPHPCAYNKLLMGWIDPYQADPLAGGQFALTPALAPAAPRACARVDISGQEFWLLEYRLQDANGDRRYTFGDDKNGNGVPDFYDMDSANGDGTPTGKFDAATDSLERVVAAEWDFAMSENNARRFGELGWGSGVYVWHIDEGVIQDVFDLPSNRFNADAGHKSVDLEEADGIQDLDSNEPSDFMLGGDRDGFRGEFAAGFGPDTRPATDTASGTRTGVAFTAFSDVVVDSFLYPLYTDPDGVTYWAFDYADSMTFTLSVAADPAAPLLHARRELPTGVDLRGGHVLLGDLDLLGGDDEIILGAGAGEVFVLDGDLNEHLDRDDDPATLAPFAVGRRGGQPVAWNLPPALGDLDGDGRPEIVLTGPDGLYAFASDGTSVRDPEAGAFGLYADVPGCGLPPVLLPADPLGAVPAPTTPVSALVVAQDAGGASLQLRGGPAADLVADLALGDGVVPAPPVLIADLVVVALADTTGGESRVLVSRWDGADLSVPLALPLAGRPGSLPLLVGVAPDSPAGDPVFYVCVVDTAGRGETLFFDAEPRLARAALRWRADLVVRAPLGLGGTFVGEDVLGRIGHGGDWLRGWPRRPLQGGLLGPASARGEPLAARLVGSTRNLDQFIFPTRDGRLFATGAEGEWETHWPLAGPAPAGTPGLGRLTGLPDADLVVTGTFDRIIGTTGERGLATVPVSSVSVWQDVAAAAPVWPMHGGSIWRNGWYDRAAWSSGPVAAAGTGLVPGSHICFPSPLQSGPLKVGGQLRSAARVRAAIYNLEGELVRETGWRDFGGVDPFVIDVDLAGAVTGMYLCRLVVDTPGDGLDNSVIQFAIVR